MDFRRMICRSDGETAAPTGRIRHFRGADGANRAHSGGFIGCDFRTQQVRNGDGRDDQNDRHNDQQFDKRETLLLLHAFSLIKEYGARAPIPAANWSTPVWSSQKERTPVVWYVDGHEFTSNPLYTVPTSFVPAACNLEPLLVFGATLKSESIRQAAAALATLQGAAPPREGKST